MNRILALAGSKPVGAGHFLGKMDTTKAFAGVLDDCIGAS